VRSVKRTLEDQKELYLAPFKPSNFKWDALMLGAQRRFWPRTGILRNTSANAHFTFYQALPILRSPGWERRWVECGYRVSRAIIRTPRKRECWNWKRW